MSQNPRNVSFLKNSNRASVLESIRRGPISRIDISRQTELTKPAVTVLTNEMIVEGLLYEVGPSKRSNAGRGRTSVLLDIVPDFAYAVGISLHRRNIHISIVNLKMEQIAGEKRATALFSSPDMAIEWCVETVKKLFFNMGVSFKKCVGIGISSPGSLNYEKGIILEPLHFSLFHHYPVVKKIKDYFDCPVFLENNSVSLALADFYMRGGGLGNSLFVVVSDGIGSTLLQDGTVFRGAHGFAGELGHVSVETQGKPCICGNVGCLEMYATLGALISKFGIGSYEKTVDRALNGDETSNEVLQYLAECFGKAFVIAINLFDLNNIVLFGEYAYHAELLTELIQKYINNHSLICKIHPVSVVPSKLLFQDMSISAAVSALNYFFEQNSNK